MGSDTTTGRAEKGMICYKGVMFTCDTENNRICLGDTTDLKKCINIPLAGGGSLLVNRDNLDEFFQGDRNVFAGGCQAHYAGNRTGYKGTADAKETGR